MKQIPNYKFSIFMNEVVVKNKPGWDYGEQIRRGFNPADNHCEWVTFGSYNLSSKKEMLDLQAFLQRIGDQEIYLENSSVKPTIEKALTNLNLMFKKEEPVKTPTDKKESRQAICCWAIILSFIALIADTDAGLMLLFLSFILSSVLVSKKFLWGVLVVLILIGSGV